MTKALEEALSVPALTQAAQVLATFRLGPHTRELGIGRGIGGDPKGP